MRDPRLKTIAKNLLEYSTEVKEGQHVYIKANVDAKPLVKEIIKHCYHLKAYPHVELLDDEITRELLMNNSKERQEAIVKWQKPKFEEISAFISIYAENNDSETTDVCIDTKMMTSKVNRPLNDIIIDTKKWVLLNYPTSSLAQKAKMSTEAFENFVFDVCTVNYAKMSSAMKNLKAYMERTDKVRLVGNGTDLSFSIKGLEAIPCAGENNIPDGEVYTAPVKNSVNGTITYNTPSPYHGTVYKNIKLTFKDGKIINATCDGDNEQLNKIFDSDEGARYIGEFAIGVNPLIKHPMGDILFDEKIDGSIHFTPGDAYSGGADNGNRSSIHWDLVLIQRAEYGGGEIYFDDVLVRKDGRFVVKELECLNPENL